MGSCRESYGRKGKGRGGLSGSRTTFPTFPTNSGFLLDFWIGKKEASGRSRDYCSTIEETRAHCRLSTVG